MSDGDGYHGGFLPQESADALRAELANERERAETAEARCGETQAKYNGAMKTVDEWHDIVRDLKAELSEAKERVSEWTRRERAQRTAALEATARGERLRGWLSMIAARSTGRPTRLDLIDARAWACSALASSNAPTPNSRWPRFWKGVESDDPMPDGWTVKEAHNPEQPQPACPHRDRCQAWKVAPEKLQWVSCAFLQPMTERV